MKRMLFHVFLWSWVLTVPVTVLGSYWAYHSFDRFFTYSVRYNPGAKVVGRELSLGSIGHYELNTLLNRVG